jgi:hypothetical protein
VYETWLAKLPSIGFGMLIIIGLAGSTTLSLSLKSAPLPWPPKGIGKLSPGLPAMAACIHTTPPALT